MGRHRAPGDDDEPVDESSDDYPESEDFGDAGGYREPPGSPPDEPSFPAPRYPSRPPEDFSDEFAASPSFFGFDEPADDRRDEFATPDRPEQDLPAADIDAPDDFPDFPRRDPVPPTPPSGPPTGGHRGLPGFSGGHRNEDGRRGVSIGVVAALISVVVVVGVVILWRFFGDALSNRSHSARCVGDKQPVAVIADPSISDQVQHFAEKFNGIAAPVGDHCVAIGVKAAGSDAVVDGFIGNWPADLGQRPALWIPGSSVSAARLTAAAGKETVSDSRSLVTSPVVLAVRPELQKELGEQKWQTLPELQTKPDSLAGLKLPTWGSLRLALPLGGNSDAAYLAGEAVAAASAPPGAPATDGTGAVRTLIGGQPKLADNSLGEAMNAMLKPSDAGDRPGACGGHHRTAGVRPRTISVRRGQHAELMAAAGRRCGRRLPHRAAQRIVAVAGASDGGQRVRSVHAQARTVGRAGQGRFPRRRHQVAEERCHQLPCAAVDPLGW